MNDLKLIKKHYGEKMMHLCRTLFPTLLETEGLLWNLLSKKFAYSRLLYDDIIQNSIIEEFKDEIYNGIDVENNNIVIDEKTPEELLSEVGYELYECHSEEDIQKFKKYYAKGEEICTFLGGRLKRCHVFFAVKKNVDEIKRENFISPRREDEYGTSVMSIQFTRDGLNVVSIKNRYNHKVNNPDATYSNNLDNIIPGLTQAFNKKYNFSTVKNTGFNFNGYVIGNDGKYYKYNYEENNTYYCPNNIIIDNFKPIKFEKPRYVVLDNFVIDTEEKTIIDYNYEQNKENGIKQDPFINTIGKINKINVITDKKTKNTTITINEDIVIVINKNNEIIEYKNNYIKNIDDDFLINNKTLEKIEFKNVENIGNNFLRKNTKLKNIDFPNLKTLGNNFMYGNKVLEEINLPNVEKIGDYFLHNNKNLKSLKLDKLIKIPNYFLTENENLEEISLNNVIEIKNVFLYKNSELKKISLPNVKYIGRDFISTTRRLEEVYIPNVKIIGDNFLENNERIIKIDLPNVEEIGDSFLAGDRDIKEINIPKVKKIGHGFLVRCWNIKELSIPNVESIGNNFFKYGALRSLNVPKLIELGTGAMEECMRFSSLNAPNLDEKSYNNLIDKIKEIYNRKEKIYEESESSRNR